ncbi:MAG: SGNH/GDSL hydrolase family protein [Ruminococcaceae bacterium]|nr:SGNH/GDSL hydrolase family protein [Oscillospiraceae bacterium]
MNLNLSQIRDITTGAVRIEEIDNGIHFYRFTKQQEELYKNRSNDFYTKTFATSGIKICFHTNSQTLFLRTEITGGSSRSYFAFDVFVNGVKIDTLDNFSDIDIPQNYTTLNFPLGEFSKEFDLGIGEKEVCVYFPWSVKATLKEFVIDDDSFIKPVKPNKKLLCFGDSITHGYDALYPSNKYITKLADMLNAGEYNKAIGGEVFFPALAATKEDFEPDYITVAYGTNDWSKRSKEELTHNCKDFLCNLSNNYPNAKIYVITPIWRKDMNESRPFGDFKSAGEIIQKQTAAFSNISVIQGFEFVPQNEDLFADLRLHPNDEGFEYYFENLSKHIKDILKKSQK